MMSNKVGSLPWFFICIDMNSKELFLFALFLQMKHKLILISEILYMLEVSLAVTLCQTGQRGINVQIYSGGFSS